MLTTPCNLWNSPQIHGAVFSLGGHFIVISKLRRPGALLLRMLSWTCWLQSLVWACGRDPGVGGGRRSQSGCKPCQAASAVVSAPLVLFPDSVATLLISKV